MRPVPCPMNIINKLMTKNMKNRNISHGCADIVYTIKLKMMQHTIEIGRSITVIAV